MRGIRSSRREGIDGLKKAQKERQDHLRHIHELREKEIQKLTDGFTKKIDDAVNAKEADILKV